MNFPSTPQQAHSAGVMDREIGNDVPGLTLEDFCREIEDTEQAEMCAAAYKDGFEGRPLGEK
jgi:hypothetical protein